MKWIDGDKLLFRLEQYRKFVEQVEDNYLALMVFNSVEREIKKLEEEGTVRCSACGNVFSENNGKWNYCPNCGAKMDLDEVNK